MDTVDSGDVLLKLEGLGFVGRRAVGGDPFLEEIIFSIIVRVFSVSFLEEFDLRSLSC